MSTGFTPVPDWIQVRPLLERCLGLSESDCEAVLSAEASESVAAQVRLLLQIEREADARHVLLPPEPDLAPEPERGAVVGAWRLLEPLGEGGMGIVWLGERADGAFQQRVAVKVFKLPLHRPELQQRFLAEVQILAALDHRGIARLLDGGRSQEGSPYLVLEYIDGEPIDAWCDERRLTVDERIRLFLRVCDAVQHAHERGVLHRDLKPAHLLVGADGEPRLVDFGIAKVVGEIEGVGQAELTGTGQRLYTPRYASPEQVRGDPTSATADVYSLGVILYELLTGTPPYPTTEISQFALERAVVETEAPRPSALAGASGAEGTSGAREAWAQRGLEVRADLRARLRGDLDWILLAALRKEPERRYSTVRELADDLRRHLAHQPVRARPESWVYRSQRFVRRHRGLTLGAATTFLTLLLAMLVVWRLHGESERLAYRSALGAAEAAIDDGLVSVAGEALRSAPASLRGWEWRHLTSRLDVSEVVMGDAWSFAGKRRAAIDPRGRYAVVHSGNSLPFHWFDASSGALLVREPISVTAGPSWRPDGSVVAGALGSRLLLIDPESGVALREQEVTTGDIFDVSFSPNGSWIGWADRSGNVGVWSPSGPPPRRWRAHDPGDLRVYWSPDGGTLASASWDETVKLWDPETGASIGVLRGHTMAVQGLDWLPDGRSLLTASLDGTVRRWNVGEPEAVWSRRFHRGFVYDVCVLPDGESAISVGFGGEVLHWDVDDPSDVERWLGHETDVFLIEPYPQGDRWLTLGGDGGRIWSTDRGGVRIGRTCEYTRDLVISPDGEQAATVGGDGVVRRWSLDGRRLSEKAPTRSTADVVGYRMALAWGDEGVWEMSFADGCFELWTPSGERVLDGVRGHPEAAIALVRDPISRRLVVCADEAVVFDPGSGQVTPLRTAEGDKVPCGGAGARPDGAEVAIGGHEGVHRWRLSDGTYIERRDLPAALQPAYIHTVEYDIAADRLIAGFVEFAPEAVGAGLVAWDLGSGAPEIRLMSANPRSLAVHPRERRLAVGRSDGQIEIVHADTLESLVTLRGHSGTVGDLHFTPDGETLVSVGSEGTVRFWRTE